MPQPTEPIDTYSEQYRHECECRFILSMPLAKRRIYLNNIEDVRGLKERQRIEATLLSMWKK